MKAIKTLTHPYLLIASFLLIVISGKHFGGFYIVYLSMALFHFGIHAVLALVGIFILVTSQSIYRRRRLFLIETILNMAGLLCLFLSLFLFFYNDAKQYNWGTFEQTVPICSLCLFVLLSVGFILSNFRKTSDRRIIAL